MYLQNGILGPVAFFLRYRTIQVTPLAMADESQGCTEREE